MFRSLSCRQTERNAFICQLYPGDASWLKHKKDLRRVMRCWGKLAVIGEESTYAQWVTAVNAPDFFSGIFGEFEESGKKSGIKVVP